MVESYRKRFMAFRKKSPSETVEEISEKINSQSEPSKENTKKELIHTGSTLLNLALSDYPSGGYRPGRIVNLVGDSATGKSLLLLSMFAEAAINPKYDKYALIYDEAEAGLEFNLEQMFGKKAAERIQIIPEKRDRPRTIQDWYHSVFDIIVTKHKQCLYGLDSFDALTSEEELKEQEVGKGGYKTEKAIASSAILRQIAKVNEGTQSLIIIISQTRQNLGALFGKKKTRSGGDALKFYSTQEIWLHNGTKITKKVGNDDIEVGRYVFVDIEKNRVTGKKRRIKIPILDGYGVDDNWSMIEWMIDKGFWEIKKEDDGKKAKIKDVNKAVIDTCGDFIDGKISEIVKHIEDNNLEDSLKNIVWESWLKIEDILAPKRKPRYV